MRSKLPSRSRRFHCWFFAFGAGFFFTAFAQPTQLLLKNGDRVSGVVVFEGTNHLVLSNAWSSAIAIPLAEVVQREKTALPPAAVGETRLPVAQGAASVSLAGKSIVDVGGGVAAKPARHLTGEAFLGMDLGFGTKTRQIYNARFKTTYVDGRFRSAFDYLFTYGRADGTLSANRMAASSKTDFDLGRRLYIYNLAAGGYDRIRKIDARYEVGPGVGYKLLTGDNHALKVEYGINYQAQYFNDDSNTKSLYHRVAEEFVWKMNTRFSFTERFEYFPKLTEISQYRLRLEANLKYVVWNNLSLNMTLIDIYDNQTAYGVQPNDLQFLSSIGWKF